MQRNSTPPYIRQITNMQENWFDPSHYQNTVQSQYVLGRVMPAILYGLEGAHSVGYEQAMTEAVAIGFLLGQGRNYQEATNLVRSWWHP